MWLYNLTDGKSRQCRSCSSSIRFQYKWDRTKYPWRITKAIETAINRCLNENHPAYGGYGGRGISVFEEWVKTPSLFADYLMSLDGWSNPRLLLDRENNNGNYEPENLIDAVTSSKNTREHARGENGQFIRAV